MLADAGERAERKDGEALHRRIRADIERNILSGAWPPGHRIPFEHELTAHYGCARMTVNKAVAELAAAGLVERRRRAGTFVAQPGIQSAVLTIPDIEAEVAGRGEAYRYELLERRVRRATRAESAAFAVPADERVLALSCRHFAGARALMIEERIIRLSAAPEAERADFTTTPPGAWLLRHVPWTEAEHRIAAMNADARVATLLDVAPGLACLAVERRTWRDAGVITHVKQIFRGDLYRLQARFSPRAAGA